MAYRALLWSTQGLQTRRHALRQTRAKFLLDGVPRRCCPVLAIANRVWTLVPRHSDCDMLNPNITATPASVSDQRGLRYCERRPVAV
jgi:hypothetical protein